MARIAGALALLGVLLALGACPWFQTAPNAPANLRIVSATATEVVLAWDTAAGATGYRVYRAGSQVADGVATTGWTDTAVAALTTYTYMVAAYNGAGESPRSNQVSTTTPDTDENLSAAAVAQGLAFMKQNPPDYVQALTKFAYAAQTDPTNAEAVLWNAGLTLMSTMVSSGMQTLASDYIGIVGYPTDMNTLFTPVNGGPPSWITYSVSTFSYYDYVGAGNGTYIWNSSTYTYEWVGQGLGDYNFVVGTTYLPQIAIPPAIRNLDGDSGTNLPEYLMGLAYNIITNNPTGFDALADHVFSTILGPALDQVVSSLTAVGDDAQIGFTWDLFIRGSSVFNPSSGWPTDQYGNPVTITIGKAELLGLSSFLRSMKTSLLMGKTVSYALPAQSYWDALNPIDHPELYEGSDMSAMLAVLYTLTTPFKAGFGSARADALQTLAQAKESYLAAIEDLDAACLLFLGRQSGSVFTLSPSSPLSPIQDNWQMTRNILSFGRILNGKVAASVENGQTLIIPTDYWQFTDGYGTFDPEAFFLYYSTAATWPTSPDDGPFTDPPTAVALNLQPMFTTTLGALTSLVDLDANGEPVWYKFDVTFGYDTVGASVTLDGAVSANDYTATTAMTATEAQDQSYDTSLEGRTDLDWPTMPMALYAFKVKDLTFGGTIVVSATLFQSLKDLFYDGLTSSGAVLDSSVLDNLLVRNPTTGAIAVYLPTVPAFVAYNSFAFGSQLPLTLDLNGDGTTESYTTKASWWWAMPTDYVWCAQFMGGYY